MLRNRVIGRLLAAGVLTTAGVAALGAAAGAAPTGATKAFTFPVSCNNGTSVQGLQFVVNNANGQGQGTQNNPRGQANFAPAHVVGSHLVYHPQVFNLTFTFIASNGETFSSTSTAAMKNPKTPITCTINYTASDPDGNTFSLVGTVKGFST